MTSIGYSIKLCSPAPSDMQRVLELIQLGPAPTPGRPITLGNPRLEPRVRRVLGYMYCHVDQKLSLAGLARQECISAPRLSHLFACETGIPPKRCLKCLRLIRARDLLEQDKLSVKEIAARVGFGPGGLIKHFEQVYGESPARYRRRFARSLMEVDFASYVPPATERELPSA